MKRYVKFLSLKNRKQRKKQKVVGGEQQPEDLSLLIYDDCIKEFGEGMSYSDFEKFLLENDKYGAILKEGDIDEILGNLEGKGLVEVVWE